MGLSGGSSGGETSTTSTNNLMERQLALQEELMGYQRQIAPEQIKYTKGAYDIQTALQPEKGELSKELMKSMPTYQQVDFNNPMVVQTRALLDSITDSNAYSDAAKEFDTSAKNREFGSSYQASRTASLEEAFKKARQTNALAALETGQNISNNNIAQAMKLMDFYTGNPLQPGVDTSAITSSSNALSNLLATRIKLDDSGMGMGDIGQIAGAIAGAFSDKRMKENIVKIATVRGITLYGFDYKPEFIERYGLPNGKQIGVMAQEVEHIPDVVFENEDGYKFVNYSEILKRIGEKDEL